MGCWLWFLECETPIWLCSHFYMTFICTSSWLLSHSFMTFVRTPSWLLLILLHDFCLYFYLTFVCMTCVSTSTCLLFLLLYGSVHNNTKLNNWLIIWKYLPGRCGDENVIMCVCMCVSVFVCLCVWERETKCRSVWLAVKCTFPQCFLIYFPVKQYLQQCKIQHHHIVRKKHSQHTLIHTHSQAQMRARTHVHKNTYEVTSTNEWEIAQENTGKALRKT